MKFCCHCGKQLHDEAVVCVGCGCSVSPVATETIAKDEVDRGLCVLSVFIPIFGIIYWIIKCKETPKKAKACGITALVTWGICFFLYFLVCIILLLLEF